MRDLLEITMLLGKLNLSSNENTMLVTLRKDQLAFSIWYTLKQIFCSESILSGFSVPEGEGKNLTKNL